MSFLIHISKKNNFTEKSPVNSDDLKSRLCPYHLNIQKTLFSPTVAVYWNSFSSLENAQFKTPAHHQNENGSAWAEFIYSDSMLKLKTDPLGQCPLWIYENEQAFFISPEQKAFSAISEFKYEQKPIQTYLKIWQRTHHESDFLNIKKISPGSALEFYFKPDLSNTSVGTQTELRITEAVLPWHNFQVNERISLTEAQDVLTEALINSAKSVHLEQSCSFLSGGIDSSVASVLGKKFSGLNKTYNLKTRLGSEQQQSEETSNFLNLPSETITFDESQMQSYFDHVCYRNEVYDGLTAEILLQLDALISALPENETCIFSGYGADLIFGGMLAHKEYLAVTGVSDTASLLDRAYWSKELSPFYYWARGKRLFHSFWNIDVIRAALQIPLSLQEQQQSQKYVLRSLAVKNQWLTQPLAFRQKLGMTNGTNMNVLFSKHLNLKTDYSFSEKTEICFEKFKNTFDSSAVRGA